MDYEKVREKVDALDRELREMGLACCVQVFSRDATEIYLHQVTLPISLGVLEIAKQDILNEQERLQMYYSHDRRPSASSSSSSAAARTSDPAHGREQM